MIQQYTWSFKWGEYSEHYKAGWSYYLTDISEMIKCPADKAQHGLTEDTKKKKKEVF